MSLTVTLGSKKYLRVNDKPRTISVRNRVFMLRSNNAKIKNPRIRLRKKKRKTQKQSV